MLDSAGHVAERSTNARPLELEPPAPIRVVIGDHDLAWLATPDQHIVDVDLELSFFHIGQRLLERRARRGLDEALQIARDAHAPLTTDLPARPQDLRVRRN